MDWNFLIRNKSAISVSTDTRNLPAGCVFFALKGQNFNGNMFALQALETGAEYAVVDEEIPLTCSMKQSYDGRIIRVENSLVALQDLARAWRRQWAEQNPQRKVVAITGTNGKTTTKELTAAVLSTKYRVLYTEGNLNNQVGVPLTLLRLTSDHDIAIVEMGASHIGDIRELVDIAEPDAGIITNVGKAHLLGFGSFEGVMQTKGELYEYLNAKQTEHNCKTVIFRNLDNQYLADMVNLYAPNVQTIGYHRKSMPEGVQLTGSYNAENIQAAITIGCYFGVTEKDALHAVVAYQPRNNRSQLVHTACNTLVVDAYNANPTSMHAAIESFLVSFGNNEQTLLILGDMLELGDYSHAEHQNIVNMLEEQKVQGVLLVGHEFAQTTAHYPVYETVEVLREQIEKQPFRGKNILLKASRGIHLEKIIDLL